MGTSPLVPFKPYIFQPALLFLPKLNTAINRLTLQPSPQQCGSTSSYCNPTTCQPSFSSPVANCTPSPYTSSIPNIDTCGPTLTTNISCPGAGIPPSRNESGYYYRCCSAAGHCGPKNSIQDQALYCGSGCQAGYGDCSTDRTPPPSPTGVASIASNGETCGPIVNKVCGDGLCCSGSNYCGMWLFYP